MVTPPPTSASSSDSPRRLRGIRGATTVTRDEALLIRDATRELLATLVERNALTSDQIVSAFFTVTPDLRSEFPARAARDLGWDDVPMLCSVEMPVPGALAYCIRVLLHVELPGEHPVRHAYLHGAEVLRPDL